MISITPMSPMPPTNSLVYGLVNNSWYFDWDLGTMLFRHLVALFYWHLVCHLLRHFVTILPWHFVTTLFWHLNWNTGTFLLGNLLTILFRNLVWHLKKWNDNMIKAKPSLKIRTASAIFWIYLGIFRDYGLWPKKYFS